MKNNERDKKETKSYAINEHKSIPSAIEIPLELHSKKYPALVDTESVENYLPERIVEDLNIRTEDVIPVKQTEVADGSIVEIKKFANIKFKLFNDENNIYTSKFYILPNPKEQPILGMRFLLENNGIINLSENFININGAEYDLNLGNNTKTAWTSS